jgi:predicted Zn-dependent protease
LRDTQNMKQHRLLPAFLLVFALGCSAARNANLISVEEEWQLGNQIAADVERQVHISSDAALNTYVRDMGQRIVAKTPMANLPWTFHVVDDPAINAFSIPGGHVYVNTGLIANAENASELAGVMAHEISHVVARHGTEQLSRQYGLSVLAGLVLGQNPSALGQIAAQVAAGGAIARFSREDEREADELGIQFMHDANYDPRGMAAMFRVLLAHQQSEPGKVEAFFSSHPTTEERVRDAEKRAASLGTASGSIADDPQFQSIRRRA